MTVAAPPRRELLLEAAAELFAARGYHAVGIDDIGAAAGISGPGVYRHFASKQALLEDLCEQAMTRILAGARAVARLQPAADAQRAETDDRAALEALVDLHVQLAVREHALLGVWVREQQALSDDARRSLRRRRRSYEQVWRTVLAGLRADLDDGGVALVVSSTLAMLNSTALVESPVPAPARARLLRAMALAALLAQDAGTATTAGGLAAGTRACRRD